MTQPRRAEIVSRVVTIDGPAGTGKSSVAKTLAGRLGFEFLDTGAMYRAVGGACLAAGADPLDADAAAAVADAMAYDAAAAGDPGLRTVEATQAASLVARHDGVRTVLLRWQREFADGRDVVTEGRDQGTIVFPDAAAKFFLDASPTERAARRVRDLAALGRPADFADTLRQIEERDHRDRTRAVAPLKPAGDAVQVDTTHMTIEQVVDRLIRECESRLGAAEGEP